MIRRDREPKIGLLRGIVRLRNLFCDLRARRDRRLTAERGFTRTDRREDERLEAGHRLFHAQHPSRRVREVRGNRESHVDLEAGRDARLEPAHDLTRMRRTSDDFQMSRGIRGHERHAHATDTCVSQCTRCGNVCDARRVRLQRDACDSCLFRRANQIEQVLAHRRLAAGEHEFGDTLTRGIVDRSEKDLACRVGAVGNDGVTELASLIAAAGDADRLGLHPSRTSVSRAVRLVARDFAFHHRAQRVDAPARSRMDRSRGGTETGSPHRDARW